VILITGPYPRHVPSKYEKTSSVDKGCKIQQIAKENAKKSIVGTHDRNPLTPYSIKRSRRQTMQVIFLPNMTDIC
jgi:hypothetical protein